MTLTSRSSIHRCRDIPIMFRLPVRYSRGARILVWFSISIMRHKDRWPCSCSLDSQGESMILKFLVLWLTGLSVGLLLGCFFFFGVLFLPKCTPFPTSPTVAQSEPLKATRKPTQKKKTNAAKPYVAGSIDVPRGRPRPTCA